MWQLPIYKWSLSLQKHRAEWQTASTKEKDNRVHEGGEESFVSSDSHKMKHMWLLLFNSLVSTAQDTWTGVTLQ